MSFDPGARYLVRRLVRTVVQLESCVYLSCNRVGSLEWLAVQYMLRLCTVHLQQSGTATSKYLLLEKAEVESGPQPWHKELTCLARSTGSLAEAGCGLDSRILGVIGGTRTPAGLVIHMYNYYMILPHTLSRHTLFLPFTPRRLDHRGMVAYYTLQFVPSQA